MHQGSGTLVTRKIGDDTVSFIWTAGPRRGGPRTPHGRDAAGGTEVLIEYRTRRSSRSGSKAAGGLVKSSTMPSH